ncbi:MAG: hypothetical protein [Bacteriophage sp.]|nr:MAG: hypothetical protein [Bacteriophage sp.]
MAKLKSVTLEDRVRYIHRVTGLQEADIKKVLDTSYLLDMNTIAEGKRILAGGYYTIYPAFRKAYSAYTPITDKPFEVPGQFMLKIRPYKKMREALKIVTDNKGK